MLNAQRKRELKKKYPNGKAVGKAFIQNYLERRKADIQPDFKTTFTSEEISYLKSTVKTQRDSELYTPYYSLYKLLRSFSRWIEHYQHVYYHGLFRGLAELSRLLTTIFKSTITASLRHQQMKKASKKQKHDILRV